MIGYWSKENNLILDFVPGYISNSLSIFSLHHHLLIVEIFQLSITIYKTTTKLRTQTFHFFFSWFNEPDSLIHDSVICCSAGLFSRSHLIFLSACCYASSSVGVKDLKWPCSHVWEFGKDNKGFLHMISHLSVYYAFFVCVFQKVKTRNWKAS